jgi:hypothetical protein
MRHLSSRESGGGVAGSPSATVTPHSQVFLPPATPFGGEINLNASQSKPEWPPRAAPPKAARTCPLS